MHHPTGDVLVADHNGLRILRFSPCLRSVRVFPFVACSEDAAPGATPRPLKIVCDSSAPSNLGYVVVWSVRDPDVGGGYHSTALYVVDISSGAFVKRVTVESRFVLRAAVAHGSGDVYVIVSPIEGEPRVHHVAVLGAGTLNVKRVFASKVRYDGYSGIGVTSDVATGALQLTDQSGDVSVYDLHGTVLSRWTPPTHLTGTISLPDGKLATYDAEAREITIREAVGGKRVHEMPSIGTSAAEHCKPQSACYNPVTRELIIACTFHGKWVLAVRRLGRVPSPLALPCCSSDSGDDDDAGPPLDHL